MSTGPGPDYPPNPDLPGPDPTPPMPPGDVPYEGVDCESCGHSADHFHVCGGRNGYYPWAPCWRCQEHIA